MSLQMGEQFGRYELVSHLGRGGMAEVWRARLLGEAGVTKPVLIKKVLPEYANDEAFIRMFISEARISATLSHGNIAQVYDFGRVDGDYFLAMEYVDGQPLHRLFKRAIRAGLPSIPIPIAVFIAAEMCRGLHYAHTRRDSHGKLLGIVHRDIAPDNVIVSYEGQVKIVDFGIAKARELRGFNTEPGVVKGKYHFFSPEQAQGEDVDARSDVWATGIVLYQLLCGRLPVSEEMPHTVMIKLSQGEFPRPSAIRSDIPPALDAIVMKALAVNRDQRYESSHVFGDALTEFLYSTTPRFSALSLSHFIQELFRQDLLSLGHPVQVPRAFQEQLAQWKGELTTAPISPVVLPTPAAPSAPLPSTNTSAPARTGLYVAVGIGAALLGAALTALLFLQGLGTSSPDAPSEPPPASTASASEPPPSPPAPALVEAAPPAEDPAPPPEKTEPPEPSEPPESEPSHAHASASYPVAAIRLDARQDIIPPATEAVELLLEPSGTYRISEPEPPPDSPPLFFWLSGPGLPAKEGVGVLPQRPLQIKGVSSFKAFGLSPLPPGAREREVLVEDVRAKTRKRVVIAPSAAARTDQAFELKNLDPSSTYLLTLVTLEPGASTRGQQGGALDTLACVRLSDTERPAPSSRDQQFLLRDGMSLSLSGASRLLCGVIDDDPSDNQGEIQIAINRTSGGREWTSPSPYTLVAPTKSGETKSAFEQAMRFFRNKQYDQAAIFAERCLALASRDADCHMLAGAIYASLPGQQDKAAEHYRVFLEMAPNHPRVPQVQRHVADLTP